MSETLRRVQELVDSYSQRNPPFVRDTAGYAFRLGSTSFGGLVG